MQAAICWVSHLDFTVHILLFSFCSASKGWLNPPLRFQDEPCRHKVLDLIGDVSLFARYGSQGLPVAHIVAYKVCIDYLITSSSFIILVE